MREMVAPEVLIGVFFLLPLVRPLIKRLWPLDGLVWLPVLALGMTIALFPAYGFRLECIPLLVYGVVFNIINFPAVLALTSHLQNDDFRERKTAFTLIAMTLLGAVMLLSLYFFPRADTVLLSDRVEALTVRDESRGEALFVRIYRGGTPDESPAEKREKARPLMVMIPPVTGSVGVTDRLCGALRDRGFTVLTYSRRNFDLPAQDDRGRRFGLPAGRCYQLFRAAAQGLSSEKANAAGRLLEEGRRQDLAFLLHSIGNRGELGGAFLREADPDCVFIAGYGAGGAALVLLAGSPNFTRQYPAVKGIIAVESPILSVLRGKERPPPEPLRLTGWFRSLVPAIRTWAAELGQQKISRVTELPKPGVPALFLLSDQMWNPRYREVRYGTILRVFRGMEQPAILAAVHGAGPLDYSDVPQKYPLYRAFFPGLRNLPKGADSLDAAALMANFAIILLKGTDTAAALPVRENFPRSRISIETGKAWNFPADRDILSP